MSDLPKHAQVVVIGGGIVGNSVAYHLARLGLKEIVMVEKRALPNTGGSTGHASNFIFPVDHSKEMTLINPGQCGSIQGLRGFSRKRWHRVGTHRSAYAGASPQNGIHQELGH